MKELRIGILGLGSWARSVHIPNLLRVPGVRISALCSRTKANLVAACNVLGERPAIFHDEESLFRWQDCDAVLITTPNYMHASQSIAALRAGKHVFCEKPLALTQPDALALREAVRASGLVFAVGLELRYADVPCAVSQFVKSGGIGKPRFISTEILRNWQLGGPGWRSVPEQSGGLFFELGCHYTDLYECLLGERTKKVHAEGSNRCGTVTDYASISLRYPSGAVGCLNLCLFASGATDRVDLEVIGEQGRVRAELLSGQVEVWQGQGQQGRRLDVGRPPDYEFIGFPGSLEILKDFAECVRQGRRPVADIEAAVSSTLTAIAGEESLRKGVPVELEVAE